MPKQMAVTRIVIVEDERQTVDELRDHLELYGYETEVALTASVGLGIIEERKMDVAIIGEDVREVSGLEILGKLRELDPDVKVVMMTGQKSKRYRSSLLKSGAQGVLGQPLDKASSLAVIEGVLKRSLSGGKKKRKRTVRAKKTAKVKARARTKAKPKATKKAAKKTAKKAKKKVKKR
ncbi:MAG: response regulator [Planctomycetes bacterium]|nr:response regulator [Planctomycetota bacterium]